MKKKLAIIGGGELGIQILNLALKDATYEVVGFFDDTIELNSTVFNLYKNIGNFNDIISLFNKGIFDCLILAIGYKHMKFRKEIFEKLSKKIPFATIIHKSCIIDDTATVKQGSIIYPGCIIDKNVIIEENVLLNLGVIIAHDSILDAHCFIAPGSMVSGFVHIKNSCFIGTGTVIIDNIKIEANCTIGAATLVNKNLIETATYVGNPVRLLKKTSKI
jgi:sugar O-acyltransferase (sialic acid O-acetyltransferase NeuD family)